MQLDLGHFQVREWRRGDEESLVRHANNPKVARNLRDRFPHPYTLDDAQAWIAHAAFEDPVTDFAIVIDGEASGGIGFERQHDVSRRSVELGYWLGEVYWGRGITTAAVRVMCEHTFANFDVCRIYSTVFEDNAASISVLKNAGFSFEGRLRKAVTKEGRTMDALMYSLLRDEVDARDRR